MITNPHTSRITRDVARLGGYSHWLLFRVFPTLVLLCLGLILLWVPRANADEYPNDLDDFAPDSGYLLLTKDGGSPVPAVMQESRAHLQISGMIAKVVLEQRFRNDSPDWVEGVYSFPLPETAAVRYLELVLGERKIVGKVREKEEARQLYQAARQQGRKASLVEQQRPNLFTNRVANIAPGETVAVRLEYVQLVDVEGDRFSLRLPTTMTPRYMPGKPQPDLSEAPPQAISPMHGWAVPTDQVPDADAISPLQHARAGSDVQPINPIRITGRLDMGMPLAEVASPYHQLALSRSAGVYEIALVGGVSEMDRDFVLTWRPVADAVPSAALFTEKVGADHYGLLMVLPPAPHRAGQAPPREMVFVVDTSGSMGGVSIEQARASLGHALQQLRPQDRFNIIEFDSSFRRLYREPVPATRHHVQRAQEFVRQLDASGGTEMLPALIAALDPPGEPDLHREQPVLRQVIFITDGAVGNEAALFEEISRRMGDTRLFTVGIGSAPNSWFMRKAAEFGRGSHTHIGALDEVGERMSELFEQLSRPAAVDISIAWPQSVEAWPERVPDLYLGQPLLVAANFGPDLPLGEVLVAGDIGGQQWQQRLLLPGGADPESVADHAGVASIWARQKITGILDQRVAGRSEKEVRQDVLKVALEHQLLSPYTSFVAVEEVVSRPADKALGSEPVANTRPRGQSPQQFAYPSGSTTGPVQLWFGLLLLFLALMARAMREGGLDRAAV